MYYLFIDESGDHNLKSLDKANDLFLLAGCIIHDSELLKLEAIVDQLKLKYFGTKEIVLHYRDIRRRDKNFEALQDKEVNQAFFKDVKHILEEIDYKVITSLIDKRTHLKEYGKASHDPYEISFNFLIEGLISVSESSVASKIIAERRGRKEDRQLLDTWIRIYRRGSFAIEPQVIQAKIKEFAMKHKHENVIGLQLADLIASSLSRQFRYPHSPEDLFESIKPKIIKDSNAYFDHGIKIFPRNSDIQKTISPLF